MNTNPVNARKEIAITPEKVNELIIRIIDEIFIYDDPIISAAKDYTVRETQKVTPYFTDFMQYYSINNKQNKTQKQIVTTFLFQHTIFISTFSLFLKENQNSKHIFFIVSNTWLEVITQLERQTKKRKGVNSIFIQLHNDITHLIKQFQINKPE
jgi:hypothetical protein